jgi:RNA polymerase sigma-70 factor (ECF subfamily)
MEEYIEEYGKDVYSFCVYLTRSRQDADDLYQQTFLVAFEKNEIDETLKPVSYLLSIAANLWNNQKRKYLWRKKKANIIYFQEENLEQIAEEAETVEETIIRRGEKELVRKLVDELPDKMRVVVLMYYMASLSIEEIAKALGIPAGTVKSRLHQAKARLKERMVGYER